MIAVSPSFRTQLLAILKGNGAVAATNFVGFLYLARALGPLNIGAYASAVVLVDVAIAAVNFGFNQAVILDRGRADIYDAAFAAVIGQGAIILAAAIVIVALAASNHLSGIHPFWLPAAIAGFRVIGLFTTLLYAEHEVGLSYTIIIRGQVIAAVCANSVAVLLSLRHESIVPLLVRDSISALIMLCTFWRFRRHGVRPSLERNALRRLFGFSSGMWALNGLEVLCNRVDSLIVSRLLGTVAMGGYYSLRSVCDGASAFLVKPVQTLVFAKYCRMEQPQVIVRVLTKLVVPYLAFLALIFATVFVLGGPMVRLLLGPEFVRFSGALPWLALGACCILWYENVKVLGMAVGVVRSALAGRVLQILVIIAVSGLLIPIYEAIGAAMAFALGALTLCVVATLALTAAIGDPDRKLR